MEPLIMPESPPAYDGIVLRAFSSADVSMLRDLATDPYVPLIGSLPARASAAEAVAFVQRQHDRLSSGVGFSFCVADQDGDEALGTAGLWLRDLAAGRATAGYTVAPRSRGRGVAVRALRALTGFAWTVPTLDRIELYVEPWNLASLRVAETAGYVREGLLRRHQQIGGRRVDMVLLAQLRPDSAEQR